MPVGTEGVLLRFVEVSLCDLERDKEETGTTDDSVGLGGRAAHLLGYFLWKKATAAAFTEEQIDKTLKRLARLTLQTTSKKTCTRCLWILGQQLFPHQVDVNITYLLESIERALSFFAESTAVEMEALTALRTLFRQASPVMMTQAHIWVPLVLPLLLVGSEKVRRKADEVLRAVPFTYPLPKALYERIVSDFTKSLLGTLNAFSQSEEEARVAAAVRVWKYVAFLTGPLVFKRDVLKGLTTVAMRFFNCEGVNIRVSAFSIWQTLADAMAAQSLFLKTTPSHQRCIPLLMKPILPFSGKDPAVSVRQAALATWSHLVVLCGTTNTNVLFDDLLMPALKAENAFLYDRDPEICMQCFDFLAFLFAPRETTNTSVTDVIHPVSLVHDRSSSPDKPALPFDLPVEVLRAYLPPLLECVYNGLTVSHRLESESRQNAVLELWRSLCLRVAGYGDNELHPETGQIWAIHQILSTVDALCVASPSDGTALRHWITVVSRVVDCVLDAFHTRVLASSLYRIPSTGHTKSVNTTPDESSGREEKTLTPAVYLMEALLGVPHVTGKIQRPYRAMLTKVLDTGTAGHDVLGFCSAVLRRLDVMNTENTHDESLVLHVWSSLAGGLQRHVDKCGDSTHGGKLFESSHKPLYEAMMFPFRQLLLSVSPSKPEEAVLNAWRGFFGSLYRVASLKGTQPNAYVEGLCDRILLSLSDPDETTKWGKGLLEMLADSTRHVVDLLDLSLRIPTRRRRGGEASDGGNIASLLRLMRRILMFLESTPHKEMESIIVTFLGSVRLLTQRMSVGSDVISLLREVSGPIGFWLGEREGELKQSAPISSEVGSLWEAVLETLQKRYTGLFDSNLLSLLQRPLKVAFEHPSRAVKNSTILFWNTTFGHAPFLEYPRSVRPVLASLRERATLLLPGWDTGIYTEEGAPATPESGIFLERHGSLLSQDGEDQEFAPPSKHVGFRGSFLRMSKGPTDEDVELPAPKHQLAPASPKEDPPQFVKITTPPKKQQRLTERQKVRRKDRSGLPLYSRLDETQSLDGLAPLVESDKEGQEESTLTSPTQPTSAGILKRGLAPNGSELAPTERARRVHFHHDIAFSSQEEKTTMVLMEDVPRKQEKQDTGTNLPDNPLHTLLKRLGLESYQSVFEKEEIVFSDLVHLTDDDLRELQLPMGPRKRLFAEIKQMRGGGRR